MPLPIAPTKGIVNFAIVSPFGHDQVDDYRQVYVHGYGYVRIYDSGILAVAIR